ncbi:2-keto-4-pentenoate hydratase [Roseococcus sp.]|uniref:2-keto-4-pentenoate hydratase n=1 Tax=Roseococcus sp. TaxID=2109646 RepID=UPI003BAD3FC5
MSAAQTILETRRARRILAPLGAASPKTSAEGYALQLEVAQALSAVPPAGFKIGAIAKQMQDYLGLHDPAAGFVPASSLNTDGATLPFADFLAVGVECEIGVRLGADLPFGPTSRAQAEAAVAEVFPAIEIVERRYGDLAEIGTPTLIADQFFHAAGVLGAPHPDWKSLDLGATRGEMTVDGVSVGSGHGRDLLGHPMESLAWLANSGAAEVFGGLRKGQVVWLGSVTPPIWLEGPCTVVVAFEGLGKVSLRFS